MELRLGRCGVTAGREWGYRKASVLGTHTIIRGGEELVHAIAAFLGCKDHEVGNHIAFEAVDQDSGRSLAFYQFSDGELRIGTNIEQKPW